MDTYMELTIYGGGEQVLAAAKEEVQRLEGLFSVTDPDSDIARINEAQGQPVPVSADTGELLAYGKVMAKQTDGALDPTIYPLVRAWGFTTDQYQVPGQAQLQELLEHVDYTKLQLTEDTVTLPAGMELDVGALAKGYTADKLSALFEEAGVKSALMSLGGNIQTLGTKPDGSLWTIGIQDPTGEGYVGTLTVGEAAVVTSGAYERYFTDENGQTYGHIIDPSTGKPVDNDLLSVTVVTEQGVYADGLSTALFVMGREGAEAFWRQSGDFDMILVTKDGQIYATEGVKGTFTLRSSADQVQWITILNETLAR
jgi:thiamine biosynthesis lipoprotein